MGCAIADFAGAKQKGICYRRIAPTLKEDKDGVMV
jgi:hypothetical protein